MCQVGMPHIHADQMGQLQSVLTYIDTRLDSQSLPETLNAIGIADM